MQIAGGRLTTEQVRAATKARVDRHRAKKQIGKFSQPDRLSNTGHSQELSVTSAVTDESLTPVNQAGNAVDPETSAEARKRAYRDGEIRSEVSTETAPIAVRQVIAMIAGLLEGTEANRRQDVRGQIIAFVNAWQPEGVPELLRSAA